MKRLLAMLVLAACDSSSTADGGLDTGVTPPCDGGCAVTLDDFCKLNPCPSDSTAAVAEACASSGAFGIKVYSGCGFTIVIANGKDTSDESVFSTDGGLVGLYHSNPFGTCCTAGPPGFEVPSIQGCTLSQPSCDAGAFDAASDASDASDDASDASDAGID